MLKQCRKIKNDLIYGVGRRFCIKQKQRALLFFHLYLTTNGWRHRSDWRRSLAAGYSPVEGRYPLVTYKSRQWLDHYLTADMIVFEFGSGGSTLYFSQKVRQVISAEHDPDWFAIMTEILDKAGVANCERKLLEAEQQTGSLPAYGPESDTSSFPRYQGLTFRNYTRAIDEFPDYSFDLVLVDGRARLSCIRKSMSKVKPGGYLVLDNSERPQYAAANQLLSAWSKHRFHGVGPHCDFVWTTTAWQAPIR